MKKANITDIPIRVLIADLKSKCTEIEQEKDRRQFFIKIAHYGKYILENRSTTTILNSLYQEAKDDAESYLKSWKEFIEVWKEYARDILKKAEEAGIKDDPNNPLSNEIASIKSRVKDNETSIWETDLHYYYIPYQTLIWEFGKLNKSHLLIPKHLKLVKPNNKEIVIYPPYQEVMDEWDKFKVAREVKVWWAHYQICRIAAGILGLEISVDYFKKNRVIDGIYKYEFDELAKGNINRSPMVLHPDKYATWVKRLHDYLIPRLERLAEDRSEIQIKTSINKPKLQASFDTRTSKIRLLEKDIPIPRNTDQFDLCKVIFEDQSSKEKEWSWDEVLEKWGSNYDDTNAWRKVYNAAREVNQKVATKTAIENLLIATTQTTRLNPDYL